MRVLHAISSLDHRQGGPAYALLGLAGHQKRAGLDVAIVAGTREGDDPAMIETLRAGGVEVTTVGPCRGPLGGHPKMRETVEAAVVDAAARKGVCHVHALWTQMQHEAARACRAAGVPYIFRPCGTLDPWCLAQSRWRKKLYMAWRLRQDLDGARLIHYTTEVERRLAEPLGLRPGTIVEPNGIDLEEFDGLPEPGTFRARFTEVGDRPILLFLSRVHLKKGLDKLIPAFAKADTGDAVLVIAGPDDRGYLAVAKQLVAEHGLDDRVVFTGILRGEERLAAFVDAELFTLPSYQENFGVAVVEALAAGLPVVISDQVNIHDEITAAGVGGVVPTEVDALADALAEWMADADRRREAGARAKTFVRERYDWAQIARRWAEHYAAIAKKKVPIPFC